VRRPVFFHHLDAPSRIKIDADFLDAGYALAIEQLLGANAVRAHAGRIHDDLGHLHD